MKIIVTANLQFDFTPYDEDAATLAAVQTEVKAEILEMLKELETKASIGVTNVITMAITATSDKANSYYQTKPA